MIALGINTGTSMDGISLAMVDVSKRPRLLSYKTYKFPTKFSMELGSARGVAESNYRLGQIFAGCASRFIKETGIKPAVIGSHGQTVFHDPPCTMQLGEGAVIASKTGITTVCDFRWQDLSVGGQGAPLIAYLDYVLFGGRGPVATLNLGGIANVTLVSKSFNNTIAFDTGPGNCVIDSLTKVYTKGKLAYDIDGNFASRGKIDSRFLEDILRHPFLQKKPPKSADSAMFRLSIGQVLLNHITTATFATAVTVAEALHKVNCRVRELIVSGGGVFNETLMLYLRSLVFPVEVVSIDRYGIHPQAKEPVLFALLAAKTLLGKPGNVPSATGAAKLVILGKIARC